MEARAHFAEVGLEIDGADARLFPFVLDRREIGEAVSGERKAIRRRRRWRLRR